MSTPDPKGTTPAELNSARAQAPSPSTGTGLAAPLVPPSPGVALAGAQPPGSPTLPDWDPSSLALLVGKLANELFTGPPNASAPAAPVAPAGSGGAGAPPIAATPPALSASPPATEGVPAALLSPFFAPLRFDGISLSESAEAPALERMRFSLLPTGADELAAPPADNLAPRYAYQIEPTSDLSLDPTRGDPFDPYAIRREFPILNERIHGKRLVWLDNAATTQKPRSVIDRLSSYYERENSNVHRAAHTLAARATDAYEGARKTVRRFLHASSEREIVFVRGATEGINLIAQSWGRRHVGPGDEIVITWLEHHANIVPWQLLCAEKGARLRVAPVNDRGQLILEEYEKLLGERTRLVALPQVSNALGTITPAREMVELAHRHGARVLVDGAQAVSHMQSDVQALDCDFYVFSGHKVFAPTGIGVVYGKGQLLDEMPPWQGGGNMIEDVTFERTTYQPAPARFEAGTGSIADAVGLGAALDWLSKLGLANVARHEHELLVYATRKLAAVPGLRIIGTAAEKAGLISFVLAGHDSPQVAKALDEEGIAVRGGHHCAQPILRRFGLESTVRASFAPYNLCEDIDALAEALHRLAAGHPSDLHR